MPSTPSYMKDVLRVYIDGTEVKTINIAELEHSAWRAFSYGTWHVFIDDSMNYES